MSAPQHRTLEVNGLQMHVAEQGEGPLVVLLHGWPESWYSWRHQLAALSAAGYHAVAPDQRGYGGTDRPERVDAYTMLHLVGDVIGLLDALGEQRAVVVGHDWGAPVAWNTALLRPDRVRGVVGLSVPYVPRGSTSQLQSARSAAGDRFYQVYFQQPGRAEAEFEADVETTIRKLLYGRPREGAAAGAGLIGANGRWLDDLELPAQLPDWLTDDDIAFYAGEFRRTGFSGGLNWYRNIDRNWELMAAWHGAPVLPPALYVAGTRDLVVGFPGMQRLLENLTAFIPNLRGTVMLDGCGHWTQQERADEVNSRLLAFLGDL